MCKWFITSITTILSFFILSIPVSATVNLRPDAMPTRNSLNIVNTHCHDENFVICFVRIVWVCVCASLSADWLSIFCAGILNMQTINKHHVFCTVYYCVSTTFVFISDIICARAHAANCIRTWLKCVSTWSEC